MSKKTIVFVASPNPQRYSYMATLALIKNGHETYPVGMRKGLIENNEILINLPIIKNVDTLTLYINPKRQKEFYPYFLSLKPKRIIFNPGTENPELVKLAEVQGIETLEACTLVLLSLKDY